MKTTHLKLWGGRTTACLGFFFTPAYASLLEAWNWHKIGNTFQMKTSLFIGFGYAVIIYLFVYLLSLWEHRGELEFPLFLMFVCFSYALWFFFRGRHHEVQIRAAIDGDFAKRSVWLAILLGFGCCQLQSALVFLCIYIVEKI